MREKRFYAPIQGRSTAAQSARTWGKKMELRGGPKLLNVKQNQKNVSRGMLEGVDARLKSGYRADGQFKALHTTEPL